MFAVPIISDKFKHDIFTQWFLKDEGETENSNWMFSQSTVYSRQVGFGLDLDLLIDD